MRYPKNNRDELTLLFILDKKHDMFSTKDLYEFLKLGTNQYDKKNTRQYVQRLEKNGFIERVWDTGSINYVCKQVKDFPVEIVDRLEGRVTK